MSCNCDNRRGLGRLGAESKKLCAGSTFHVGFQLAFSLSPYFLNDLSEAVEGCLYQTGGFGSVSVQVTEGAFYVYVLVRGVTAVDFGQVEDVGALIAGVINQCGGKQIGRRDPVEVDSSPEGATEDCQPRKITNEPAVTQPGQNTGILDSLFGAKSNSSGLLIIGGLLALVLVLKK